MLGQQGGSQDRLLSSFNRDDCVPRNHLLRGSDRFFDLGAMGHHLAPFYSHTGRPSIDPELMMRMLILGCGFGIHRRATAMRTGSPESGLWLVLPTRS